MTGRGISRGRGSSFTGGRGSNHGGFRGARGGSHQVVGPPTVVQEIGSFLHACDGQMVCESTNPKIPYFNAPIYLENKTPIGKVDEVLGPINQVYFTIKTQDGIVATSFKSGDKFYIGGDKLLPLDKFLPKPKPPPGASKPKRAGGVSRGGPMRGGRGRGGRGGYRSENPRGGGFTPGRSRGRGSTRGNSTLSRSGGSNRGRRS